MTYRFQTVVNISGGLTMAHGLATAPDEFWASPLNASAVGVYFVGVPGTVSVGVTGGTIGPATACITARIAHTIIK